MKEQGARNVVVIPLLVKLITGRTHHVSLDELIVKEKLFKYNK